jgi:hypothetical protein
VNSAVAVTATTTMVAAKTRFLDSGNGEIGSRLRRALTGEQQHEQHQRSER